jgi:hypothetical protein
MHGLSLLMDSFSLLCSIKTSSWSYRSSLYSAQHELVTPCTVHSHSNTPNSVAAEATSCPVEKTWTFPWWRDTPHPPRDKNLMSVQMSSSADFAWWTSWVLCNLCDKSPLLVVPWCQGPIAKTVAWHRWYRLQDKWERLHFQSCCEGCTALECHLERLTHTGNRAATLVRYLSSESNP